MSDERRNPMFNAKPNNCDVSQLKKCAAANTADASSPGKRTIRMLFDVISGGKNSNCNLCAIRELALTKSQLNVAATIVNPNVHQSDTVRSNPIRPANPAHRADEIIN